MNYLAEALQNIILISVIIISIDNEIIFQKASAK